MNPTYKVGDVVQIISEEEVYSCPTDDRGNFFYSCPFQLRLVRFF